jgi:hypothetical protein
MFCVDCRRRHISISTFIYTDGHNIVAAQVLNPWQPQHGLTSDQYRSTFNELVSQGYRLNYVSDYTADNEPLYAAICLLQRGSTP